MAFRKQWLVPVVLAVVALPAPYLLAADATPWKQQDEEAWRAKRSANLQKPDGWFSLVGLDWLQVGKTTVGTAADNRIRLTGDAAPHVAVLDLEGTRVQLLAPEGGFPTVATASLCASRTRRPLHASSFTVSTGMRQTRSSESFRSGCHTPLRTM
jgi:uncharacterized protein (DUF1684 family)